MELIDFTGSGSGSGSGFRSGWDGYVGLAGSTHDYLSHDCIRSSSFFLLLCISRR